MKTYRAIKRSHLTDKDAQRIGTFIDRKFGAAGTSPEELLDASRARRAATHRYFEWDDQAAAHEHRLTQARYLLRSIEVVVERPTGEKTTTRAYHPIHLTNDDGTTARRYVPQEVVWSSPVMTDQVLAAARRELEGWAGRYEQYEEMGAHVASARELAARIG